MLRKLMAAFGFAVTISFALAAPGSAQLLQRKDLSLSVALTIANGALDACK